MQLKKNKQTNKMDKSRKRVEQDYARNAIADGNTKAGKYEAKMAVKEAAGESPARMYGKKKGSPMHQDRTLNAKGQTQQEVNDSRLSDITSAQKAASDFSNKINSNKVGFNDDQMKALQGKMDKMNLSSEQAIGRQNFSADSINKVNQGFKASDIKKQNDAFNALMGGEGSPAHNQNKGYESAGQERKNLMNDNPIDSRASGGSWMSKHTSSRMGSPMKMDYGSPMEKELVGKQGNLPEALKSKIEAAPEMRRQGSPMHQDRTLNAKGQTQKEVNDSRLSDITSAQKAASDFSNKINSNKVGFNDDQMKALQGKMDKLNLSSEQAIGRQNFSADSINKVNKGFKAADIKKQNDAFNALMGGK